MKQLFFISWFCLPWLVAEAESSAEPAKPPAPLSLIVELTDGSRLIGTAEIETLPFIAKYGRMSLAMKEVASVTLGKDRETGKVTMKNGDNLQGVLDIGDLKLRTLMGEISVPIRHVSRIAVTKGVIRRGLVLYYSFDGKGEMARDLSGKGNHGKIHGAKWTAKGKVGGAYEFDGKSAYVSRDYDGRSALFAVEPPLSVAAWFRTSSQSPLAQSVLGTHCAGRPDGYFLTVRTGPQWGGNFRGEIGFSLGARLLSKLPVNDGRWHHAVGTWDGEQARLFVDGSLQGLAKATRPALAYPNRPPFHVGHIPNAPPTRDSDYYFKGTIDEVMVFNRALPAKEVQLLWKSP